MDLSIPIDHEENQVNSELCISKVSDGLRNVKPEAYTPVVVSIGPYHKDGHGLQAMQQRKKLYLNSLLERKNKSPESREISLAKAKFDSEAPKCYVDLVNSKIDGFAEMMLLDGCFIVEFLRKIDEDVDEEFDEDDPISREPLKKIQIRCDMMLLENQLPYFVLSEVYNMTKSPGEKPLEEMVMSCFNFMLPRPRLNVKNINTEEINHLLHLIHVFCRPSNEDSNISVPTTCFSFFSERIIAKKQGFEESSDDQSRCPLLHQNNNSGNDKRYEMTNQMGTVVDLQEAGVKFEKFDKIYKGALKKKPEEEEDHYVSLFDIDFKCGVMKVPCFKVDDTTETLLRNLIAYEQNFQKATDNVPPNYFTDFASFMNQLINSKKDAKVLRFEGIIMNFLADDKELSQLFNRLAENVCQSPQPYYLELYENVDKHCKTNCNILMAKLLRDYFKNPWAGISTVAAVILLLLTVGQFVIALLTLLA